ncbi:stereocilin [Alosa alosa]|nr:stereocilin [Alosa alosa]
MCHPGASKLQALQMLVRCGMAELQPHVDRLLTQSVASALGQATSLSVVLLVALEESQMTSVQVTENIRLSVLKSVQRYMEKESNFDNKRILLQCFGKVLTNLMQQGRVVTSDTFSLIKEYFHIPLDKLQTVLSAVDTTTIRLILEYFSRNRATLHLSEEYLQTMVSVFFHTHLAQDASLFRELSPLIAMASPADIQALPALHSNPYILPTINSLVPSLTAERRYALGRWFACSMSSANLTAGGLSLIRDTGNLIAYLPFHRFQHLSPAQLLDGLDVLLQNTLTPLQQYFMAQTLTGTFRNLTADQFRRLGNVTCLANPTGLLQYAHTEAFMAIQQSVRECVAQGYRVPSSMVSSVVLASSDLSSPSSLSAESLVELSHFLPQLGTDFLSKLSQSKLNFALPSLASVAFSPAQAGVIVDKLSAAVSLVEPGRLSSLGSLVSGVRVETLWGITSDSLLSALPNISLHQPGLTPPQANAITTKLWGFPEVTGWLGKLEPLLSSTPLLSVLPRTPRLVPTAASRTQPWTTQQAIALFEEAHKQKSAMTVQDLLALGTIAPGVSCRALKRMFQVTPSLDTMRDVLVFLRTQPVPLHTSLKKCIIEELYQLDFFSELLGELGAQIALSLPVSTIKKFPPDMMEALRRMVLQESQVFMLLPTTKKLLLVDKMLQRLNMYTGIYTEEEFRGMGVMATYVADEVFMQVNRQFLLDSLEMLQDLCYVGTKLELVAQMLQENSTFGPVQNWTLEVLIQVGRFLFFLKKETLQLIPAAVMTQERIERLFMSQQQWEESEFGALCMQSMEVQERQELFNKQQFVLQFFLGFLKVNRASAALVPSCESLHVTRPSAWSINSLTAMTAASFTRCLELLGADPYLPTYQLQTLLTKAKEVYGPASSLSPSVIGQLGRLSSQFSVEELGRLNLSELRAVAALGAINTWSSRQLSVLFLRMLNSTKLTPSQLDSSSLVALGYIICGAEAPVMRNLNAVEFSKAVLWLGRLRLQCSEVQQRALVGLLSHSLAFGPISSWGTDVFLEISGLAVGLSDMEMSSLVREQIEGLTPLAVSLIPPDRFTVVFQPVQISMFSYEQAVAVTKAQLAALSTEQQTALSMVINPWEDKPVDFRGRSSGVAVFPCPLCQLGELLMLLSLQLLFTSCA